MKLGNKDNKATERSDNQSKAEHLAYFFMVLFTYFKMSDTSLFQEFCLYILV